MKFVVPGSAERLVMADGSRLHVTLLSSLQFTIPPLIPSGLRKPAGTTKLALSRSIYC